jgi:hypothetical protein
LKVDAGIMQKDYTLKRFIVILAVSLMFVFHVSAQFRNGFSSDSISLDPSGVHGWTFYAGDGSVDMSFRSRKGYASINVDATKDKRGIWWALIRRCVSGSMNVGLLTKPENALRIEARIRVSHAPRRINLHLNTQRTTDFHTHLMEFDIPDTSNWYTISMTTHDFDAHQGDTVYGQLALMDWGLEKYRVDIDYFKVDIVNTDSAGSDQGVQVPYHPPVPDPMTYAYHIPVAQDGMIDVEYPDMNFNNWSTQDDSGKIHVLTVNSTQYVILRWDLMKFTGKKVIGSGVLELTTYSLQRSHEYMKDFGMVRVTEIIGGNPQWNQNEVTYSSFCKGQSLNSVLNSQMIIDIEVSEKRGDRNLITIPNPVLQRMINGKTLGLAMRPLGVVNASFHAMENQDGKFSAQLHFNLNSESLIPVQLDH